VSSSGLVLLAFGGRALQEQILAGPLVRYTARTLADPAALRAALAEVRRQEVACLPGHVHEDALGIAVPVRDGTPTVVAALAAIVPVDTARHAVTGVLAAAARGIARALANGEGAAIPRSAH
jgi:DNA-binding IclR family transcriptional regulator